MSRTRLSERSAIATAKRPATTSAQLAALLAARSPAPAAPDALVVAHMDADVIRLDRTCR
ncbi:MAG: hypothetical protein M3N52_05745 [Actinomycetota bacterium]|nr:hypothetical protein [Actinomycetota bacterium]